MKCNIARRTIVIFSLAMLYLSLAATVQAQECSVAGAAGKWGFSTSGTVVGIGPRASLGILTLDGHGNVVNGKETASLNGTVAGETFSGTYSVNPDCTGKLTVDVFDSSGTTKLFTATLDVVYDDNMQGLRAIFTSLVLPDNTALKTVINVDARRTFKAD